MQALSAQNFNIFNQLLLKDVEGLTTDGIGPIIGNTLPRIIIISLNLCWT